MNLGEREQEKTSRGNAAGRATGRGGRREWPLRSPWPDEAAQRRAARN